MSRSLFTAALEAEWNRTARPTSAAWKELAEHLADNDAKSADPERWVVNLSDPFVELVREIKRSSHQARPVLLAGARGSGRSLLLALFDRACRQSGLLQGEKWAVHDLMHVDKEGDQLIEKQAISWQQARLDGCLDYLLLDDAHLDDMAHPRLRHLFRFLRSDPPATVLTIDFFHLHAWRMHGILGEREERIVTIHPYHGKELRALWDVSFGGLLTDDDLLDRAVAFAYRNPRLLLQQGVHLASELEQGRQNAERIFDRLWTVGGYKKAEQLRTSAELDGTRRDILIRVCDRGPATATQLARVLDLDRSLCSYHLKNLEKEGILLRSHRGPEVLYHAHEPVRTVVETYLVMGYE